MTKDQETQHPFYQFVDSTEFIIAPATLSVLGFVNIGVPGLIIGGAVGTIEEVALHYKYYDKPYLASAMLSWGAFYSFKMPYYLNQVLGASFGALLPTNIIEPHLDKILSPIRGAYYGKIVLGNSYGTTLGLAAGILDEVLIYNNVTNQQYLIQSLESYAKFTIYNPIIEGFEQSNQIINPKNIVTFIYPLLHAFDSGNNQTEALPILLLRDKLYGSNKKVLAEDDLNDISRKQVISLTATHLAGMKFKLALAGYQQNVVGQFHKMTLGAFPNFLMGYKNFIAFVAISIANDLVAKIINSHFNIKLGNLMQDSISQQILDKDVSIYLARNHSSEININTILKNKDNDVSYIIDTGNFLLSDCLTSLTKGLFASAYIYESGASDMVIFVQDYKAASRYITMFLSNKEEEDSARIKDLQTMQASFDEYVRTHASEMVQNDANNFIAAKRREITNELKSLNAKKSIYELISFPWKEFTNFADTFYNYLIIGYKVSRGALLLDDRFKVLFLSYDINAMLGWEAGNRAKIAKLDQSTERFSGLVSLINEVKLPLKHEVKFSGVKAEKKAICLNNLTIGIKDTIISHTDDLCIKSNIVAVTGASGGGKSSFLKILKQIKHDDVWGEGNIIFHSITGEVPDFRMASQKTFLPPYSTLLEIITLKQGDEARKYESQVVKLLQEIEINAKEDSKTGINLIERINQKEDWEKILSGGQVQKLAAVRIIWQKSGWVLLDELLKGLDPHSNGLVLGMLTKYLDAMVLIIDHEYLAHNSGGFYKENLHFANKTATIGCLGIECEASW